jgi:thiamine biosynthesis lipoprotein
MSVLKNNKTRRRFLKIVGIASVGVISGTTLVKLTREDTLKKVTWKGIALGSPAEITIYHPNKKEAEDILSNSYKKLLQLESIFSLYKNDSQLSMLNKNGYLKNPDPDMVTLLNLSKEYAEMTNGAFDVTVQPLWNLYNEAFTKKNKPPLESEIKKALTLVDWRSISVDKNLINYEINGMSSTLNGIAQGYITIKFQKI